MKFLKVAVMSAIALAYGSAYAFHSGGVAECEGCHSMHNSYEGSHNVTGTADGDPSGIYLLKAADQSGTCLNCHGVGTTLASYHVSTEGVNAGDATLPAQMTPGGDFSWLKKTMTFSVRNNPATNVGERHGHNIIATDFGYGADPKLVVAPGGTYAASNLHCSSCHDPHGKYRRLADSSIVTTGLPIRNSGSYNNSLDPISGIYAVGVYRLLAGTGYAPRSYPAVPFTSNSPAAVVSSSYNRAETTQAGQTFVAYGQGMSEWCANCHTAFIQSGYTSGMAGLRHPAGNGSDLTAPIVANYNAYVTSGIMTNVTVNAAYSSLVPFEVGSADYTVLKARAALTGAVDRSAGPTNNVACLSCHRAHASGFESMLRFFYLNEFMTIGDDAGVASYDSNTTEGKINYGYSAAQQQRAYYERPASMFGPYARSQCNKCHAKD